MTSTVVAAATPTTKPSLATAAALVMLFALLPISTDLYLASLPSIRKHFDASVSDAQLTLSVFLLGFGVSQLIYGPASDRFGRRPALLFGVVLYVASSIACGFAQSLPQMIAARFFQAVGACAGAVAGRAVVRDIYGAEGAARALGYLTSWMAVFPLLGPPLGGVVEQAIGWRWNFGVLALIGGVLLALLATRMPESNHHRNPNALQLKPMLANYAALLRERRYVGYALCLAFAYSGLFAFISLSSFVLIGYLGTSPTFYGVMFGTVVAGFITGSLLTGRFAKRLGSERLLAIGSRLALLAGAVMVTLAIFGVYTVWAVIAPMFAYMVATGLNMPNAMAGAIGPFPKMAGAASALLGFGQMACAATTGFVAGKLHTGSPLVMSAAVAIMGALVFAAFHGLVKEKRRA